MTRKRIAVLAALCAGCLGIFGCGKKELSMEDAKPYAVAWMIDNCKQYRCDDRAGPYGAMVNDYQREDGWVFVIQTTPERVGENPEQLHLLIPNKNPRERVLLED